MYSSCPSIALFFFFYFSAHHRDLHSFPTRRSSDLTSFHDALYVRDLLGLKRAPEFDDWLFRTDRKSTRLNSSHVRISYAVFCLKKKRGVNACALLPERGLWTEIALT